MASTSIDEMAMNTWNYRVMKFVDADGEPWHEIREVYYTDEKPTAYSGKAADVSSVENIIGLKWVLDRMREALDKPVLEEADFGDSQSAPS